MINNFSIENFKSFSSGDTMKFAPITLIYGPNSSGKSSIIQALLMLKQTIGKENAQGELESEGDLISLGSFSNFIYSHDDNLMVKFNLQYTTKYDALDFKTEYSYEMLFGNDEVRSVKLNYDKKGTVGHLSEFEFNCSDRVFYSVKRSRESSEGFLYRLNKNNLRSSVAKNNRVESRDGYSYNEIDDSLEFPFKIDHKINLPKSVSNKPSETMLSSYTSQILDDIDNLLRNMKYLGPLRSAPKRFYTSEDNDYKKHEGKGNLGFDLHSATSEIKNVINGYLNRFDIPYKLDTKNIGNSQSGDIISVELEDKRNNTTVTPKDVGFGIGQVLPIILEGLVSKKHIICVEQPEIHLHPRLQAHLADLFIDSSEKNNNQWVIETHSESLMLRIQRRIREKKISKDLISVLYVDVGNHGAVVRQMSIDDDGDFIEHWPGGFFEERLDEMFGGDA
ncbi:AAA family ATPase [Vibrio alginolyticus]|uniref:AAA family ATPase n=1 Tax=Vibrio alginolyticus TaxID=663 RepID=UPI001BD4A52A|nr:AAA family ATPase [Vibrio alginolyticus]